MTSPARPPRLPVAQGVQLTLNLTHGGQPAAVVLGFELQGASDVGPVLAAALRDHAWNTFRPLMTASVVCQGAVLRSVSGDNAVAEVAAPAQAGGSGTGTEALAGACTLIKWTTAQGGRSGKGRTFLPGLSREWVDANGRSYISTWQQAVPPKIAAYLGAIPGAADVKPAILSFRTGNTNLITGGSLATIVGMQRKRMRA